MFGGLAVKISRAWVKLKNREGIKMSYTWFLQHLTPRAAHLKAMGVDLGLKRLL